MTMFITTTYYQKRHSIPIIQINTLYMSLTWDMQIWHILFILFKNKFTLKDKQNHMPWFIKDYTTIYECGMIFKLAHKQHWLCFKVLFLEIVTNCYMQKNQAFRESITFLTLWENKSTQDVHVCLGTQLCPTYCDSME